MVALKVVYGWFHGDELFYVGIGSRLRSQRTINRNQHCLNKRAKAEREGTFRVEILYENLTNEQACEIECQLIQQYGRIDLGTGCLTNMTNGGEGIKGFSHSQKTKDHLSKSLSNRPERTGENNYFYGKRHTKQTIDRMRVNNTGNLVVQTPFGQFVSARLASKHIGCSKNTITNRCRNENFPDWYFVN